MHRKLALGSLLVLASTLLAGFAGASTAEAVPLCGSPLPHGGRVAGTYELSGTPGTTLVLGRSQTGFDRITMTIVGCILPRNDESVPGLYQPPISGTHFVPTGDLVIRQRRLSDHFIVVQVYLIKRSQLAPGKYVGDVLVDPNETFGHTFEVPLTIDVQEQRWWLVALLTFPPVLLLGIALVWWRLSLSNSEIPSLRAWIFRPHTLVAAVIALSAPIGVWLKRYWDVPTWGSSPLDEWWSLAGLMLAAYTTAFTAATGLSETGKRALASRATTPAPASTDRSPPGPTGA